MTIEELNKILLNGEDVRTEYKQSWRKVPNNFYDTICSFLNKEGGIIILGADDFKTIIPLSRPVLGDRAGQLLEFSDIDKSIPGYEAINILKDISIHPDLNKTEDINAFLFKMGLSWAEKGVKLKELRVRINSELEFSEFKKGSSWAEKGVKLLKKRSMNILKLLIFTLIPAKIDELRINMDFGSRDKLRELYLNPLRKSGLIEFTIKDKPNDPNQKYVITEKGEMFLGGFDV